MSLKKLSSIISLVSKMIWAKINNHNIKVWCAMSVEIEYVPKFDPDAGKG